MTPVRNQIIPIHTGPDDIHSAVERTLAENLRLRGWLTRFSNCQGESTADERYAKKVRHMARRALAGDGV